MEVRTTEGMKRKYLLWHLAIAAVYLGLLVGPGVWWAWYYVVVGSVVFGLILFFSFRSHVQAAFALKRTRPATCIRQGSEQGCFGFGDSDFGFGGSAAPRVSLVIPSFNEEAVLRQTIPSVPALFTHGAAHGLRLLRCARNDIGAQGSAWQPRGSAGGTERHYEVISGTAEAGRRIRRVSRGGRRVSANS